MASVFCVLGAYFGWEPNRRWKEATIKMKLANTQCGTMGIVPPVQR